MQSVKQRPRTDTQLQAPITSDISDGQEKWAVFPLVGPESLRKYGESILRSERSSAHHKQARTRYVVVPGLGAQS